MRTIFLDTSYLLALIRKRDARHEDALTASTNHSGPFITTDLVLVELANCLAQPPYRAAAVAIIEKIRSDRNTRVVSFDSEGMEKALALYKERPDKSWGLVDCFSFGGIKGTLPLFRLFSAMLRLPRTVFAGIPHCVTQR